MAIMCVYLVVGGVITAGFGIAYLVRPRTMARMVGIELQSAPARADYRAIYGGAQIALGLFFCLAARYPAWRVPGLVALILFALGFGITRLISLAYDGVGDNFQWIVGVLEVAAGLIGAALLATGW